MFVSVWFVGSVFGRFVRLGIERSAREEDW